MIVQFADHHTADAHGHVLIDNVGSGRATVFTGGAAIKGVWKKKDGPGRTRFCDAATGAEIALAPGATWIEVGDLSGAAEVTN